MVSKHEARYNANFVPREQEPPPPTLQRKRPHVLEPGMVCENSAGERWTVIKVNGFWCRAEQGRAKERSEQCFPCDALLPVIDFKETKTAGVVLTVRKVDERGKVIKPPKPPKEDTRPRDYKGRIAAKPLDDIGMQLLACGADLDALWKFAVKSGLPKDLRAKLSHLNPGLQRMNIGNRLRAAAKKAAPKAEK